MARPTVIDDQTILEAARDVFLAMGVGATTARVAERAGVSEGTIFKRFKSKENLFVAAMAVDLEDLDFTKTLPSRVGNGVLQDHLYEVSLSAIAFFRRLVPLVMMSWSHPSSRAHEAPPGRDHPAVEGFRQVEAYFEGERRAGRLRSVDTEVLARIFVGGLWHFAAMEVLQGAREKRPMSPEAYCRSLVDILLRGVDTNPLR
jgi:AcrR family transcriptional regulator